MASAALAEVLPEWESFVHAAGSRRPDSGTWCEGWTVRDVLAHQAGNALELRRVLERHMAGTPVQTRSFEEREAPFRAMNDSDLWAAFTRESEQLAEVSQTAVREAARDTQIDWFGRTVGAGFFGEHMREELILHRWDIAGDDAVSTDSLMQPWITTHTVVDVGSPLLAKGIAALRRDGDVQVVARLRCPGTQDVLISATAGEGSVHLVPQDGEAAIESDPAVRVLLLWGRRPADASRWHSQAGQETLGRLRRLLSGY